MKVTNWCISKWDIQLSREQNAVARGTEEVQEDCKGTRGVSFTEKMILSDVETRKKYQDFT